MQTWCTAPFQISFSTTVLFATTTTKETIRSLSGGGGSRQLIGPLQRESYWYVDSLIIISPEKIIEKKNNRKKQKKKHFRFFNRRIIPPINGGAALYERDSAQGLIIILRSYMYVYKLSYREREREREIKFKWLILWEKQSFIGPIDFPHRALKHQRIGDAYLYILLYTLIPYSLERNDIAEARLYLMDILSCRFCGGERGRIEGKWSCVAGRPIKETQRLINL
jgi:hypothetical protein